jgi:hypothetical protein
MYLWDIFVCRSIAALTNKQLKGSSHCRTTQENPEGPIQSIVMPERSVLPIELSREVHSQTPDRCGSVKDRPHFDSHHRIRVLSIRSFKSVERPLLLGDPARLCI